MFELTQDLLDERICDVEDDADNEQTFREFIRECEEEFCLDEADLDTMSDEELTEYLNWLDELACK